MMNPFPPPPCLGFHSFTTGPLAHGNCYLIPKNHASSVPYLMQPPLSNVVSPSLSPGGVGGGESSGSPVLWGVLVPPPGPQVDSLSSWQPNSQLPGAQTQGFWRHLLAIAYATGAEASVVFLILKIITVLAKPVKNPKQMGNSLENSMIRQHHVSEACWTYFTWFLIWSGYILFLPMEITSKI